jgi:predicted RND superfamily exporter protein
MMARTAQLIIHRPKTILLCIFLLTAFFAFHARQIELDSSLDSLLPQDDPEQAYYEEVRQLFGSDEAAIIGVNADNVYTPSAILVRLRITTLGSSL